VRLLLNQVPRLLATVAMLNARAEKISAGDPLSREPVVDPLKDINDCKALLKTLTLGLKTVLVRDSIMTTIIHNVSRVTSAGSSEELAKSHVN
jgi:hypothetical protein